MKSRTGLRIRFPLPRTYVSSWQGPLRFPRLPGIFLVPVGLIPLGPADPGPWGSFLISNCRPRVKYLAVRCCLAQVGPKGPTWRLTHGSLEDTASLREDKNARAYFSSFGARLPFWPGPLDGYSLFILFSGLRIILALVLAVYYFIF